MLITPTGSFSSPDQNTLLNGLVAHWDFEEASGTRFDKVASNHLTDNNTVTQGTGKFGNAAQFTAASSEWLEVENNSSLSMKGTSFTITGWVNFASIDASANCLWSKSSNNVSDNEYNLDINSADPKLRFVMSSLVGAANITIKSLTNLVINQWYFYECYYDLPNQLIGCATNNGTFGTASTSGGSYLYQPFPFKFGRFHLTAPRYFNGRQDSVSIWKRLLTPAERNWLWNSGNGRAYPFT